MIHEFLQTISQFIITLITLMRVHKKAQNIMLDHWKHLWGNWELSR